MNLCSSLTKVTFKDKNIIYTIFMNKVANIEIMFCPAFASVLSKEDIEYENQYMSEIVI